jgi:hypothetical protein
MRRGRVHLRALDLRDRNRLSGIGPGVTLGLFQRGTTAGVLDVRDAWDPEARTSLEGNPDLRRARVRQRRMLWIAGLAWSQKPTGASSVWLAA